MNARPQLVRPAEPPAVEGLERHYTPDELVAAGIAPSRATAWAWCRRRKLRHVRIGHSLLIPESAVQEFLAKQTIEVSR